jgi:hypothetical protein
MDISKFLKLKGSAPSLIDEAAYELIALELSSNQVKQGLWTKALADSEWEEAKAKSYYVKMRHEQLIDEINCRDSLNNKSKNPYQEALEYGLSNEEIEYLGIPIKAILYLGKYKKTQQQVSSAISNKRLSAVMKNDMLWVSDKPI